MDVEEIIQVIVDNGRLEDMHELSDMLEDTIEMLKEYYPEEYKKYQMQLYEMAYGEILCDELKIEWVKNMRPEARWNIEEIEDIYQRYGLEMPLYSFFVIMNMLYSDLGRALGEVNNNDSLTKYIQATKDWYFDEDARNTQEVKLYNYWKYIVN
jgi:hypothetical protein